MKKHKNALKCIKLEHPNLMPGWGCCECNTYNGNPRLVCKVPSCGHERCDIDKKALEQYKNQLN
ncbi:hypothetical protein CMI47_13035 [Candidatus Pacearchaeota archaeon]|nr:hypothetical protein [Candidatus Pacearchaeota archaeon]|tara:strand:+ start:27165 stop:27356 length:192 start_codon:yes stop_codon:yes gene_type:complete